MSPSFCQFLFFSFITFCPLSVYKQTIAYNFEAKLMSWKTEHQTYALGIRAGAWKILKFHDEGQTFNATSKDGDYYEGVVFKVDALNKATGEEEIGTEWKVTSGKLLSQLAKIDDLTKVTFSFMATGEGKNRRYADFHVEEIAPKKVTKK